MRTFRGNEKGFTIIELLVAIAIIGILALIAIPHFLELRRKSLDRVAMAVGMNANAAEELHYTLQGNSVKSYTTNLNTLLNYDKNLTEHTYVTLNFLYGSTDGFTLYTKHMNGTGKTYMFTSEMRYQD